MSEHGLPADVSRRQMLLRSAAIAAIAAPGTALAAGCAAGSGSAPKSTTGSSSGGGSTSSGGSSSADPKNPFGVKDSDPLDVYVFKGGYGDDYAKAFEEQYKKAHPGANVTHKGAQDVTGDLQPRFNAGSPPDVIDDSGAKQIKLDVLNKNGQLTNLDKLLDAPSIDDPSKKVRDTLLPGTVEIGLLGSSMFSLNYAFTVWGLWYSSTLFQKNGWQIPKTWDDFMTLCATIKGTGMAPFCHQGKYPYYMMVPLMDMVAKNGGPDAMTAIDNLEPNAWKSDAVKNSVDALYMLVDKGYMLPGTEGLTHIQSQTQWNQGKAAVIPCGSWLENEQLAATPADFGMAVFAMPSLSGDKMPGTAIRAGAGEPFIVPAKAKNQAGGLEFLRIMCSKAGGASFAQNANSLSVVKDAITPDIAAKLKPGTKSSNDLYSAANGQIITWYYLNWYSQFESDLEDAMSQLMANKIKPDEFITRAQKAADKCAADSSVQKFKRPTT
ncbi:N-acetylglucosamine/diacetylchitobiose ABC transporter substrate-binding protein [Catenulispora subtropica]|uniref:N-acetylglucosamine/diacetylchitobiose ABC transporter substrate-binding protein n=1 Tax=Catenulispora subtropica TaxID=450798 RepID=A0ABN2RS47_9ACTN